MNEHFVTVRGLSLCLCDFGPEDGDLVLALHGYLDQGASWEMVGGHLAPHGYRLVVPDARGHGRSDHVGAGGYYHFADYLVDLDGIADHLSPEQPFALVGHSMGGSVASQYAGARPDRVDALINIEGLGPPRVSDDHAAGQLVAHMRQLRHPPVHPRIADLDEGVTRMRRYTPEMSEALARRLVERVAEPLEGGGLRWRWDLLHRTRAAYAFDADRFLELLGRVRAPTTLIEGETCPFTLPDVEERVGRLAISRRVGLPSGHNPHIECPDRLAEEIHAAIIWARSRQEEMG